MFELEKEIDLVDLDDKTDRFSQIILKNSNCAPSKGYVI